jgi:hypothetical protein
LKEHKDMQVRMVSLGRFDLPKTIVERKPACAVLVWNAGGKLWRKSCESRIWAAYWYLSDRTVFKIAITRIIYTNLAESRNKSGKH